MPYPFEQAKDAISKAKNILSSVDLSERERVELLQSVTDVALVLEKPEDAVTKVVYSPSQFVAVRVCSDLKLFERIVQLGSVTSIELARATGADRLLIERLLRVVVASGFVLEPAVTTYAPNRVTEVLATRTMKGLVNAIYDVGLPGLVAIPEFLRKTEYKNPDDVTNGPFQLSKGLKDTHIFSWLGEHPREMELMQTFFEADRGSRPNWVEWFPVKEHLLQDATLKEGEVLLVDVAGGRGHEISAFLHKFPDLRGRLILQDLPQVLEGGSLDLNARIEKQAMDFWIEGPVPGARIYYMKFIMHDWSDEKCLQILGHVTEAMKNSSVLIIEEFIIPDMNCHLLPAMWDMEMIAFMSAMERTKTQWRQLLKAANLDIVGMYDPPGDGTGIIVSRLIP